VKTLKALAAAGLLALAATAGMLWPKPPAARSVAPLQLASTLPAPKFSRQESTGLFVGVRDFPHDPMLTVPYAVDDAVDLAFLFALDQRVGLVPPRRVVLAISGQPQKDESDRKSVV